MALSENFLEDSFRRAMAGESSLGDLICTGSLLMRARDYARSEQVFRQILARDPYDMSATFMVGLMLLKQGRSDEAENFFRDVVQDNADDSDGYVYLARSMADQHRYEEAMEQFWEAMGLEPLHGDIYFRISEMFESLGQIEHAIFYNHVFAICARNARDAEEQQLAWARFEHLRQIQDKSGPPPSWRAFAV